MAHAVKYILVPKINFDFKIFRLERLSKHQLEYWLRASCLSYNDCKEIMKVCTPTLCHKYHIHRHMSRKLMCSSKTYGGLDVIHLYDLMGIIKTKFLIKHL